MASPSRESPVQESPTGAVTIPFAIDLWPIAGLDLLLVVDYFSSEVVIAYLLAVVTFALIATSAVMLLRQYRAETAPARDVPPEAPEAAAEPASEHQPPAEASAPVDSPPEAPASVDPPPEAPPPADPPPEPPASDAPTRDAAPVATRPRGTVPARRKRVAEQVAPPTPDSSPSPDPSPAPAPARAPRAAARRAAAPMPAREAAEVCQVHWLGRGRGSCFAAVTVDAKGVKHTLATSRRVEWRDSAPPTETPQSQAAVRQLMRILRDNGWEPLRGNGEDLGQERWYARRFRRTAGPGGRRAPTRTARTGDAT